MTAIEERRCDVCNASLEGRASTARRCSGRCRAEGWRRDHGLVVTRDRGECAYCHGPIPESRRSDARYCSDAHRIAAAQARRALTETSPRDDRLAEISRQLAALAVEVHQLSRGTR